MRVKGQHTKREIIAMTTIPTLQHILSASESSFEQEDLRPAQAVVSDRGQRLTSQYAVQHRKATHYNNV
jgi:hypothetical protein